MKREVLEKVSYFFNSQGLDGRDKKIAQISIIFCPVLALSGYSYFENSPAIHLWPYNVRFIGAYMVYV